MNEDHLIFHLIKEDSKRFCYLEELACRLLLICILFVDLHNRTLNCSALHRTTKELRNKDFKEVQLSNNRKMDNDKMIHEIDNETCKKIDESIVKIETMEPKQSSENVALNFVEVPSIETDHSIATTPKKRRYTILQPKPKHHHLFESSSIRKIRFRPIQPKPSENNTILKNKLEMPVNIASLSPDHVFGARTVPIEKNIHLTYVTSSDISDEIHCRKNSNNGDNSNTVTFELTEKNKINETVNTKNSNIRVNSNISKINNSSNSNINNNSSSNCKDLRYIKKPTAKFRKNSIQLFFESMAQTVLNLPNEIQAEIKMEICKIVTMAEIKCSQSQFKIN